MGFAAITFRVAYRVFIVVSIYFIITQSRNFWICPHVLSLKSSMFYIFVTYCTLIVC
jgi:hypothetical protein